MKTDVKPMDCIGHLHLEMNILDRESYSNGRAVERLSWLFITLEIYVFKLSGTCVQLVVWAVGGKTV